MGERYTVGHQALVAVLAEAREKAGLSQRDLSNALKRSHNFVNYIEIGQHIPTALEFIAIAEALGIAPATLMGRVVKRIKLVK